MPKKTFLIFIAGLTASLLSCKSNPSAQQKAELEAKLAAEKAEKIKKEEADALYEQCKTWFKKFPRKITTEDLAIACTDVKVLSGCESTKGTKIFHYDKTAPAPEKAARNILVFALIHGDETPSGVVAQAWMTRLKKIEPRSNWRVVPILNPDGFELKTRMNANKIDINRNFPTKNWKKLSQKRWKRKKKDPRRFPGTEPGSEKETQCAMAHINDFKPNFIISIHTPYGVLDFDGPRINAPKFKPLPWISLGNYPGSLGRYMWQERRIPVLTIELKGNNIAEKLEKFDKLQDLSGSIAMQAEKIMQKNAKKAAKRKKNMKKNPKLTMRTKSSRTN